MFEFQPSPVQPIWYTGLGAAHRRSGTGPAATRAGWSFVQILRAIPGWFTRRDGKSAFLPAGAPAHRSPSACSGCC